MTQQSMTLRQAYNTVACEAANAVGTAMGVVTAVVCPPVLMFTAVPLACLASLYITDVAFNDAKNIKANINETKEAAKVIFADLKARIS